MADTKSKSATCKLCYEPFSSKIVERVPRRLICPHTFCTECLQKLKMLQGHTIECPLCFMITRTPLEGIDYLPKDKQILAQINYRKPLKKCSYCIKVTYPPKSATLHCLNCSTVYCGSCSDKVHLREENQDHTIRLVSSTERRPVTKSAVALEQKPSKKSVNLICTSHSQVLSYFCQKDQVRCCMQCRLSPKHQSHDCEIVQDNDNEKNALIDWQMKLDDFVESQSKTRIAVQTTIEELRKNTRSTNDNIKKVFRGLRSLLDEVEKDLVKEVENVSQNKLNQLQNQCCSMIEIANNAKTISQLCEQSLQMEFFEMLVQKKKLEKDVIKMLENSSNNQHSCENSDLYVQFPNHETLMYSIKNLPFLVQKPPPPVNFRCVLTHESEVFMSWSLPKKMKYIYPVNLYAVYGSVGENESFELLQKVGKSVCVIPISSDKLRGKYMVQFKVTAINVVGESDSCFPICIRLIKMRPQMDSPISM